MNYLKIPLHGQRLNYETNVCELEDHVREKGWNLNWLKKLGPPKKIHLVSFPNCLLKNTWVKFAFPYAMSPCHEKAKRNTNGVVGGASAKLPHCIGRAVTYRMENEMPLVHHIVERWGCDYTNKDNKGLIERTQWHLMLKPKSKLM